MVLLAVVLIVIGVVVAGGWFVWHKQQSKAGDTHDGATLTGWDEGCTNDQRVSMTHIPMNMDDVATVSPLGLTAGAHVTPIDHLYFYPQDSSRDKFPVYAMADGTIIDISVRAVMTDTGEPKAPEYRIVMQHSCQTVSYFDLVTKLDQSILDAFPDAASKGMKGRFAVKAGQEIGRIGGQSLDTAIYNLDLILPGFIHPEMYSAEPWKVHTDDFFSYFNESLQSKMLAKNQRVAEPRSGKIDYDQPGKLVGNWFKQGTNGYGGPNGEGVGQNGQGYWSGHLAVFYAALDPSQIVVSIGDFQGQPQAFGVRGNAPDPAAVDTSSGIVAYELIQIATGVGTTAVNPATAQTKGTVLFQVLPGEKVKVQVFPGRDPADIAGFTGSAVVYER